VASVARRNVEHLEVALAQSQHSDGLALRAVQDPHLVEDDRLADPLAGRLLIQGRFGHHGALGVQVQVRERVRLGEDGPADGDIV
jgi:hypothetical protein